MDFKIFAAELFNIFPKASLAQTLDLYSALRLGTADLGTADPVAVARDDVVIREHMTNGNKDADLQEASFQDGSGTFSTQRRPWKFIVGDHTHHRTVDTPNLADIRIHSVH